MRNSAIVLILGLLMVPCVAAANPDTRATPAFERGAAATVTVRSQGIEGIGVAVVDGTLVITARHLVTNTGWVEVEGPRKAKAAARVLYWDEQLAVLSLDQPLEGVEPVEIAVDAPVVGARVWLITETAAKGLGRWAMHEARIAAAGKVKLEVDVQGSSARFGSPVLDRAGRLAGVVTSPSRGQVIARGPSALARILQDSAGESRGPAKAVGVGVDFVVQWYRPLLDEAETEREFGLGLEGYILGGRYLMVPWAVRVAGTTGFWRPSSGEPNHSRLQALLGIGGDFELTAGRDPYVPFVIQLYGLAGIGLHTERSYAHTLQLSDPTCNPASGECSIVLDRTEVNARSVPFVFGGGVRLRFSAVGLGFEITSSATAPAEDLRLLITLCLGGRENRIQD